MKIIVNNEIHFISDINILDRAEQKLIQITTEDNLIFIIPLDDLHAIIIK